MILLNLTIRCSLKDGQITLYNKSGDRITTVSHDLLGELPTDHAIMWNEWARNAVNRGPVGAWNLRLREQDPWEQKIDAMRMSWKCRSQSLNRGRKQQTRRSKTHNTWDKCLLQMMQSKRAKEARADKHLANPWELWAETKCGNQNKRYEDRYQNR